LLSILLLAVPSEVYSQNAAQLEPDQSVSNLIANLESGDRSRSLNLVKGIFLISELEKLVETPSEFVDLVVGCDAIHQESRMLLGNPASRFAWDCRRRHIEAWMARDPEGSLVEVWDVADDAMIAARANARPVRPPTLEEAGIRPPARQPKEGRE